MFSQSERKPDRRWTVSQTVSLLVHCVVIWLLVRQPAPMFVQPSSVLKGAGGSSLALVFLPTQATSGRAVASLPHKSLAAPPKKTPKQITLTAKAPQSEGEKARGADLAVARAGSPYGSLASGSIYGHEIRPALPTNFHDPVVPRSQLPDGVQGDVVVEVTIDAAGQITDKKIIKSLGYGIEEKVLAALGDWRFRPATQDGVPIPSQQYVYFHFQS